MTPGDCPGFSRHPGIPGKLHPVKQMIKLSKKEQKRLMVLNQAGEGRMRAMEAAGLAQVQRLVAVDGNPVE